jgi:hypothetical protein
MPSPSSGRPFLKACGRAVKGSGGLGGRWNGGEEDLDVATRRTSPLVVGFLSGLMFVPTVGPLRVRAVSGLAFRSEAGTSRTTECHASRRGPLALWHYGPYFRLTCACSSEGRCVRKSHLEQTRSVTGSTAKLPLSCGRSTSQGKLRLSIRSGGLLFGLVVLPGRFAPDVGTIVRAGVEQLRGCYGGPRGRSAPEAARSPGTGW